MASPSSTGREVDPIPIDFAALERIVSSAPDSQRARSATERLAALLSVSRSARVSGAATDSDAAPKVPPGPKRVARVELARAHERAGDPARAQQVWRHVVCPALHDAPVPFDGAAEGRLVPLAGDHDDSFWQQWYDKHPKPLDQDPRARPGTPASDELEYRPIFAERCLRPDLDVANRGANRQLADAWLSIGRFFAAGQHQASGPYAQHRAREAFTHALDFSRTAQDAELTASVLVMLANTHFKMQRYRTAVAASREALKAIDELSSPGLRAALTRRPTYIIASSLTYVDFDGPPPDDPLIVRNDTLDLETDPLVAERKMHVGIDRLRDPAIVPPKRRWTASVYLALIDEYASMPQQRNLIDVAQAFLSAYPSHPTAPEVALRIAQTRSLLSRLAPESSPEKVELWDASDAALAGVLTSYGPGSSWAKANLGDAKALSRAKTVIEDARADLEKSRAERSVGQP